MKRASPAASADDTAPGGDNPAKRARGAAVEEADPLDAFMAEINDVMSNQGANGDAGAATEAIAPVRCGRAAWARVLRRGKRSAARKRCFTALNAHSPIWPWTSSPTVWTPMWRRIRPMRGTLSAQVATRRRGVRAKGPCRIAAPNTPHAGCNGRSGAGRS